ncbi:MAG: TIR domain-containing protein [Oscillospiraceae bacterium]|nr:TIR domain-containing protein [Oscillospiraceae bacterium]
MSQLFFKPERNASVRDLPRVYFCCHPKDFDIYFEDISNEILSKQNCTVWYHGKTPVNYNDEFFEDLLQMHLFVVPVTNRFLKKGNPVLEREFRFALENHIPILPLMQEKDLVGKFNAMCGSIQYLDKYNNDHTCIEYGEKLNNFLSSVLVGDDLVKMIHHAFNKRIFLSYRKKDRHYAQALMKQIHQNRFCQDVAIWYDEFLVPGEDFNASIQDALLKSDLFVMTVTPNLVNETNYIMNVEFPMARDREKPILPCEMVDTNHHLLSQKYENIPECTDGRDSIALGERLRSYFGGDSTENRYFHPLQQFFIGMAYLRGIDVEVDRERALEMIIGAAEADFAEAIEQLAKMYTNGDGVAVDMGKALYWRRKLLDVTEMRHRHQKTYASGYPYMRACFELANMTYAMGLYKDAMATSMQLKDICTSIETEIHCSREESAILRRHCAIADYLLGQVYQTTADYSRAMEHYRSAMDQFERLNAETEDPNCLSDTSILYNKFAQFCKIQSKYTEALHYYEKSLQLQQHVAEHYGNEQSLLEQTMIRFQMSEILRIIDNVPKAKALCLSSLAILDRLIKDYGIEKYINYKMMLLYGLAESLRVGADLQGALNVHKQIACLEETYLELFGEIPVFIRAKRLGTTAQIHAQQSDFEPAIASGEQALAYIESRSLITEDYISTGGTDLTSLYFFVGMSYYIGRNDLIRATKYMDLALQTTEDYISRGILSSLPDYIIIYSTYANLLKQNGDLSGSSALLQKAATLYEKHLSGQENFRNFGAAFALYIALGNNFIAKDMPSEAIRFLKKAETLYHKIIDMNPASIEATYRDYGQMCFFLAGCYADTDDPQAEDYYLECVNAYDRVPQNTYTLSDWNFVGISFLQLFITANGFLKERKWKKRMLDAARKLQQMFPENYQETPFYQFLRENEII